MTEARRDDVRLEGDLEIPPHASGLVIFAHGSGSSRKSPRNMQVARHLQREGIATLLFDLLTPEEGEDGSKVFDIELLADRLMGATHWVRHRPECKDLKIAYFGASTGAAAALVAAAKEDTPISAVVSRGGRPDLAGQYLTEVSAPTLLIVGGDDRPTLSVNEEAAKSLETSRLIIVPDATHLFEEPGALEQVAGLAAAWFREHFDSRRNKRFVA